MSNVIL